jgi:hypothetical protein
MQKMDPLHRQHPTFGSPWIAQRGSHMQDKVQDLGDKNGKADSGLKQRRGITQGSAGMYGQGHVHSDDNDSYTDIGNAILDIYNAQCRNGNDNTVRKKKKLRFYVCGHSLGGGLATIFLAKMVQCNSPLLDILAGLYT